MSSTNFFFKLICLTLMDRIHRNAFQKLTTKNRGKAVDAFSFFFWGGGHLLQREKTEVAQKKSLR